MATGLPAPSQHEPDPPQDTDLFQTPIRQLEDSIGSLGIGLAFSVFLMIAVVAVSFSRYRVYLSESGNDTFGLAVASLLIAGCMVWILGVLDVTRKQFHLTFLGFFLSIVGVITGLSFLVMLLLYGGWWPFCLGLFTITMTVIALKAIFSETGSNGITGSETSAANTPGNRPRGLEYLDNLLEHEDTHTSSNRFKEIFLDKERLLAEVELEILHKKQITRKAFYDSEETRLKMKQLRHLLEIEELIPLILKYYFGEDFDDGDDSNLNDLFGKKV